MMAKIENIAEYTDIKKLMNLLVKYHQELCDTKVKHALETNELKKEFFAQKCRDLQKIYSVISYKLREKREITIFVPSKTQEKFEYVKRKSPELLYKKITAAINSVYVSQKKAKVLSKKVK